MAREGADGTLGGQVRLPFFTKGYEGLNIDHERDWELAERLAESGAAPLPRIDRDPYPLPG